jgi:sensor histidine kinase regulating citrate/malate metabolism
MLIIGAGMAMVAGLAGTIDLLIRKTNQIEKQNQKMQIYMDDMQDIYGTLEGRIDAARKFRHDLDSHIQTMAYMMEAQEEAVSECQPYENSLIFGCEEPSKDRYCSDAIVDNFLHMKKTQCEASEIGLKIQIEADGELWLQPAERIGLLHNLLDNAIEANERISVDEKREIELYMNASTDNLMIRISNCLAQGEIVTFKSTKTDGGDHGIGTQIVDALVKKYNGTKEILWDQGNHIFTVIVCLCRG